VRKQTHQLKPLQPGNMPGHVIFFDTETFLIPENEQEVRHLLRLGVMAYVRFRNDRRRTRFEPVTFTTTEAFWERVFLHTHPKRTLYLVAHNVLYDIAVLQFIPYLDSAGFHLESMYVTYSTVILRYRRESEQIIIMDNRNLFPGKLEQWGERLGLEKLPMPEENAPFEAWETYCRRDVHIMVESWRRWLTLIREEKLGPFRLTIAGQALAAFRSRFMSHTIWVHADAEAIRTEREAYRGGRTQAFYVGRLENGPYYKLDVNSMYPYVMREEEYPVCLIGRRDNVTLPELEIRLRMYNVIANVTIRTNIDAYPVRYSNRTIYPIGEFRTTLCTNELRYALARDDIVKVHYLYYYRPRPIFRTYVDYCIQRKVEAERKNDPVGRYLWKLMMNSLYGKFGQKACELQLMGEDPWCEFGVIPWLDAKTGERTLVYVIGHRAYRVVRDKEGFNSFVAIAAEVTANARMYLFSLIQVAGRNNVFYCDTDSLIVNQQGYDNLRHLLSDTELGKLKLEGIAEEIELRAPKDYSFGGEDKIKGIPKSARQLEPGVFEFDFWPRLGTLLRNPDKGGYWTERRIKRLRRKIEYGIVTDSGWVKPYKVGEDIILE